MFDHLELTAVMTSIFGTEQTNRRVLRSDMSEERTLLTAFCVNHQGAGQRHYSI